jgi:hypothetical protein
MKKLILLLLLPLAMVGCSKSESTPNSQSIDPVGSKYRRLTWGVGREGNYRYDVLDFASDSVVIRDTRLHNGDNDGISIPENLKWEKTATGINIWISGSAEPRTGTVTNNSILLDMEGSEDWVYEKY